MFRLSRVIFRPYKAQIQGYLSVSCTLGSQALGIPACVLTDISYTYILGKHIGITNIKKKTTFTATTCLEAILEVGLHISSLLTHDHYISMSIHNYRPHVQHLTRNTGITLVSKL